jgi:hypothetical protein
MVSIPKLLEERVIAALADSMGSNMTDLVGLTWILHRQRFQHHRINEAEDCAERQ